jgi:hypothetical protein
LGALDAEKGTALLTVDEFIQPGTRIA